MLRFVQFLISGFVYIFTKIMNLYFKILKIIAVIIFFIAVFSAVFGHNMWWAFIRFLINIFILYLISSYPDEIVDFISSIFGIFSKENTENRNIFEEYENQFSNWYRDSGYYNNYRENFTDGETDNIIQKFEEYLNYLGISQENLSNSLIRKGYRNKMKEIHPDKNINSDTTSEAQKLNEIKEFLEINLEYYLMKKGGK